MRSKATDARIVDWTSEEYHAATDYLSRSMLHAAIDDPLLFSQVMSGERAPAERTASMQFGSDVEHFYRTSEFEQKWPPHGVIAVPDDVLDDSGNRRGKKYLDWYRAQKKELGDAFDPKLVMSATNYHFEQIEFGKKQRPVRDAVQQLHSTPKAVKLLDGDWHECIVWKYDGYDFRVQLDVWNKHVMQHGAIVDLKTSKDVSQNTRIGFPDSIVKFWYDVQAFLGVWAVEQLIGHRLPYFWVVVKNKPAYDVEIYQATNDVLEFGERRFYDAFSLFKERNELGRIRRESHNVVRPSLVPAWATSKNWIAAWRDAPES